MAIYSVSRREDIPAFGWNEFRVNVLNNNGINAENAEGFVYWTKNPCDTMFEDLKSRSVEALDRPWYIQWTINPYGIDVEPNVPRKSTIVIPKMIRWAETFGAQRIIWRYDPILISDVYSVQYHIDNFERMAEMLNGSFRKCVISFLDMYGFVIPRCQEAGIRPPTKEEQDILCRAFVEIAKRNGDFAIEACAESLDLKKYGIGHTHCVDYRILHELGMDPHELMKDPSQRKACGCMPSIDVGGYNKCKHGCVYCYATK